jgi:prefoldin subunit 5
MTQMRHRNENENSAVRTLEDKVSQLERRVAELMQESARMHALLTQLSESTARLSESMIEVGHRTMGSMRVGGGGGLG